MLDKNDLQAIAELMDEKIGASEARTAKRINDAESRMVALMEEKIGASEARTAERINDSESRMVALMEAYFEPRFNLLGDQLKLLQEKMIPVDALDDLEERTTVLEAAVKQHSREINALKKAQ